MNHIDAEELLAEVERLQDEKGCDTCIMALTHDEWKEQVDRLTTENAKLQEKQTAKVPVNIPRVWPDGREYVLTVCPVCGESVSTDEKFCSECGQKLLWEE